MAQSNLVEKSDIFAHAVYKASRNFPKEELFGVTSQLRRAALSITLNIVEGFARQKDREFQHFLSIAYGSFKETKYLLHFSFKENYLSKVEYQELLIMAEEIGRLLWGAMRRVRARYEKVQN